MPVSESESPLKPDSLSAGRKDVRRKEIATTLAASLLETGLGDTGLRTLAAIAGTSDRMLLYYFENKEDLLTAVLMETGAGVESELGELLGNARLPPTVALESLWQMVRGEIFGNHLRLWLEISSQALRGDVLFRAIVNRMSEGWISWLSGIVDAPAAEKNALAALILGTVNGQMVLFPEDLKKGDPAIASLKKMLASSAANRNNRSGKKTGKPTKKEGEHDERKSRRAVQLPDPTGRTRRVAGPG